MDALGTLSGDAMGNMRLRNSTLPCESPPLNGRVGYAAMMMYFVINLFHFLKIYVVPVTN
jgi:hypothetical protein